MLAILGHVVAFGLLALAFAHLLWAFGRISAQRGKRLDAIAASRGWSPPVEGNDDTLGLEATIDGVPVTLRVTPYLVRARATSARHGVVLIRRRIDGEGLDGYPSLTRATTGDPAFDDTCDLFTEDGAAPAWLDAPRRAQWTALSRPVTATVGADHVAVELLRTEQNPNVLAGLVDLAAATADPRVTPVVPPPPAGRPAAELHFRLLLVAIPFAAVVGTILCMVPSIQALQSQLFCGSGPPLSWKSVEMGAHHYFAGCGGVGEGIDNLSAWLLATEAVLLPVATFSFLRST
ncbi:MAG: hypothetical protein KC731_24080 [Myxococcales bacterium]|nr:hypothetical protein [Myxococcales bacterium]